MSRSRGSRGNKKNNQIKLMSVVFLAGVVFGALILIFYNLSEDSHYRAKKQAYPAKKVSPARAQPAPKEETARVKIAIVLDDFGYNNKNADAVFAFKRPVTFSILPNHAYSKAIAKRAHQNNYESILHLPMEAHAEDKRIKPESDTISTTMTGEEVLARLTKDIESVPFVNGVSNHQGSMATEDIALMRVIFTELKKRNLFFLDSLVTNKSVCRKVARQVGVKFIRRDIFLDNSEDFKYIEGQMRQLIKKAKEAGWAIGIGHDRTATVSALSKLMPEAEKEGIEFVFLSELVK